MTKFINPGIMKTNRRNVLRGSVLAGAAALTGAGAMARTRTSKLDIANGELTDGTQFMAELIEGKLD